MYSYSRETSKLRKVNSPGLDIQKGIDKREPLSRITEETCGLELYTILLMAVLDVSFHSTSLSTIIIRQSFKENFKWAARTNLRANENSNCCGASEPEASERSSRPNLCMRVRKCAEHLSSPVFRHQLRLVFRRNYVSGWLFKKS